MRTCVIIPTYNEANKIAGLLKEIAMQELDVLVIDDGSSDDTFRIAKNCGAITLRNEKNQGKGASLIKGFDYALTYGYDAVITMDGDGQHLPEDIPYFMRLAKYSDSAIFIGNRMQKVKNMPLARIITNRFMSWFLSCLANQRIPDTQCGFRLIKKEVLKRVELKTSKYETESEILIKSSRLGFKIESVSIKTIYTQEKSHINPFIDTLRFIRLVLRELREDAFPKK
ncbi:MAG: glycosyltransferase family 2 protein [Candidatus Omnitrophota bacterium]